VTSADVPPELRPLMRGVVHAWTFWFALAAAIVLVVIASGTTARVSAAIYGMGLCLLFAGSGLYHRWRWNERWRPLLRRVDHSTIFVFIAASYTPITLLILDGGTKTGVLIGVWAGALAGVIFSLAWIGAPRGLVAATYLGLGWAALAALPQLIDRLPAMPLALLAAGGAAYTAGAVIYALRRPDPWPRVFGFHEVFHALVVIAAALHFVAIAGWVVPLG